MVRLYGSLLGLLIEESAGVNQTLLHGKLPKCVAGSPLLVAETAPSTAPARESELAGP